MVYYFEDFINDLNLRNLLQQSLYPRYPLGIFSKLILLITIFLLILVLLVLLLLLNRLLLIFPIPIVLGPALTIFFVIIIIIFVMYAIKSGSFHLRYHAKYQVRSNFLETAVRFGLNPPSHPLAWIPGMVVISALLLVDGL